MDIQYRNIAFGILVLVAVGGVMLTLSGYRFASVTDQAATPQVAISSEKEVYNPTPTVPETVQITDKLRGYTNDDYRFSLHYPHDMLAREYAEQGGAMNVTFEHPETGYGFQVYVTPYAEDYVTQKQLQLDLTSGVMEDPVDIVIDNVRGTMFFSENSIMGATREVWFISNGFLYEVVTYKDLDEWLATIMATWQFQ